MKRDYLTGLGLEAGMVDQVMAEYGRSSQDLQAQLTASQAEVANLTTTIATRDADIKALHEASTGNETLQTQLTELQTKYDGLDSQHKTEVQAIQKDAAVDRMALKYKAKNVVATRATLKEKLDELEFTDKDFETKLDGIFAEDVEATAYMYGEDVPEQTPPTKPIVNPGNPNPGAQGDPDDPFAAKLAKYE